jgi:hypothetical protein
MRGRWEYRLAGAPDPVATANLRWLSGYRHPRYGIPAKAAALRASANNRRNCNLNLDASRSQAVARAQELGLLEG